MVPRRSPGWRPADAAARAVVGLVPVDGGGDGRWARRWRPGGPGGGGPGGGGPGGRRPGWRRRRTRRARLAGASRTPWPSATDAATRALTYNGNASFSLDNSALDARTFSVTGANVAKPAYANGRGGVMFGGPLRIPKLVSAGKHILFTFNYQFQRNRTGTTSNPVNMPTALERTGDFSQSRCQGAAVTIYDPTTGAPFPGNRIPANRISATATALLKYFPNPNLPFATRNYQTSLNGRNNSQNMNSRDLQHPDRQQGPVNGGLGYQGSSSITPNLFQFIDTGSGRGINANLAGRTPSRRRLINNLHYTFSRSRQLSVPYFADRENVAAELGIAGHLAGALQLGTAQPELHQLRRPQRRQLLAQPQPDQRGRRQPDLGPRHAQFHFRRRLPAAAESTNSPTTTGAALTASTARPPVTW